MLDGISLLGIIIGSFVVAGIIAVYIGRCVLSYCHNVREQIKRSPRIKVYPVK